MNERIVIREYVRSILASNGDHEPFSDSEQLATCGRLQSIDMLDIVVFLEAKYAVDFAEIGFDQDQVESIDAILELIKKS